MLAFQNNVTCGGPHFPLTMRALMMEAYEGFVKFPLTKRFATPLMIVFLRENTTDIERRRADNATTRTLLTIRSVPTGDNGLSGPRVRWIPTPPPPLALSTPH